MMRIGILILACALAACVTARPRPQLRHQLAEHSPKNVLGFDSAEASVLLHPDYDEVAFTIRNNTAAPAFIVWDEAAIIDPDGVTERVYHYGVKFINRNEPQKPTVIPAGSFVKDALLPSSRAYLVSGRYGGWRQLPFITPAWLGRPWKILLPVKFGEKVEYYDFTINSELATPATSVPVAALPVPRDADY